ncbi:MAG: hypothetical protein ACE14V_13230 [bacterium]
MYKYFLNPDMQNKDISTKIGSSIMLGPLELYQQGYYISSLKLLLIAVDTMAYLKKGDNNPEDFKKWIIDYVDLSPVGITSEELWEHRNALLHTTTAESRKVKNGQYLPLFPYKEPAIPFESSKFKLYSINKLWEEMAKGFDKFLDEVYNNNELKIIVENNWKKIIADQPSIYVRKSNP